MARLSSSRPVPPTPIQYFRALAEQVIALIEVDAERLDSELWHPVPAAMIKGRQRIEAEMTVAHQPLRRRRGAR